MADNPILMLLEGNGSLAGRDRSGAFTATGSGALRYAPAPGARVNYALNPRFAVDANNWGPNLAGVTVARVADARFSGGFAGEITIDGSAPGQGVQQSLVATPYNLPPSFTNVTISFDIAIQSGDGSNMRVGISKADAAGTFVSGGVNGSFAGPAIGTVERRSVTIGAPASLVGTEKLYPRIENTSAAPLVFRISNIVFEFGSVPSATAFTGIWLDPRTGQLGPPNASPSVSRAVFWVEEATTNLFPNPSAEVNTTGAAVTAGLTLSRSTAVAYLGAASFQVDHDGNTTKRIVIETIGTLGYTGSVRTFIASVWARGAAAVYVDLAVTYTDATATTTSTVNYTLTGAWQRLVTPTVALDASKTVQRFTLSVRLNGNQAAGTFYCDCAQVEEKSYATSYCDGSLGTGYTWAGTAHASASSRAVALVSVPAANHYTPNTGAMLARGYRDFVTGGAALVQIAPFGDPVYDGLQFRAGGGAPQQVAASWWIANTSGFVGSGVSDMPATTWVNPYTDWSGTVIRSGVGTSALATGSRPAGAIGTGPGALLYIGPYNAPTFGRIGPVAIYERPLDDVERSKVNNAITDGADLWEVLLAAPAGSSYLMGWQGGIRTHRKRITEKDMLLPIEKPGDWDARR